MSSITFFKPNAKNTGCAARFYTSKDKTDNGAYLNMAKQVSWDAATRKGSFKSDKAENKIAVKFNLFELASIALAIETKTKYSTVHVFGEDTTSITFGPWDKNGVVAYGLSISRGKQKFSISFEPNEAYALKLFCNHQIVASMNSTDET